MSQNTGGGQDAKPVYLGGPEGQAMALAWLVQTILLNERGNIEHADLERLVADEAGHRFDGGARRLTILVSKERCAEHAGDEPSQAFGEWLTEMRASVERGVIAAFRCDPVEPLQMRSDELVRSRQTVVFVLGVKVRG